MQIKSYAKINLYLSILKKRNDGYHDIETVFNTVSLFDSLNIQKAEHFKVKIKPDNKIGGLLDYRILEKDNLFTNIYEYFKKTYKIGPIEIEILKKIPIGAGLGGGSSNAAAFIYAINKLYNLDLTESEQIKISSMFGADIPFFVRGGLALGQGVGEKLNYIQSKHFYYLLIYPKIHISTAAAYQEYAIITPDNNIKLFLDSVKNNNFKEMIKYKYNCFQEKVLQNYVIINKCLTDLKYYTDFTLLSGSGSTVYGLFNNIERAQKAYLQLRESYECAYLVHSVEQGMERDY